MVTGWICDIGQNILQSSFQTGSNSIPSYFQIFICISFLKEAVITNIMVIPCSNYIIIICINDNVVINNNYGWFQDLILPFRIPMGTWKNLFKIHGQFGHVPLERFASHGLEHAVSVMCPFIHYLSDICSVFLVWHWIWLGQLAFIGMFAAL